MTLGHQIGLFIFSLKVYFWFWFQKLNLKQQLAENTNMSWNLLRLGRWQHRSRVQQEIFLVG